jgi:DNA-binding MarR family transcriptional regulator/N-acetylglutamate synthase-like GNAT family acetyltransferase
MGALFPIIVELDAGKHLVDDLKHRIILTARCPAMLDTRLSASVEAVRGFNRFYTQKIGVLQEGLLESPFSLTEARVLYELGRLGRATASELCETLGLDAGYLSRILQRFEKRRLVAKTSSPSDGRQSLLSLAASGRKAFAALQSRSRREVGALIRALPAAEQARLVTAMGAIERLLGGGAPDGAPYLLRPHRLGDFGWIVHRHAVLYAEEFGWDGSFEALVAEIVAKFIARHDPTVERCWVAERHGEIVGSVLLVKRSKRVAQLRLLLVEPQARGLGIGGRLVEECLRFARQAGYRKATLWTQSMLRAARHLYDAAGFRRVREEPHQSFGKDLVGEYWELEL